MTFCLLSYETPEGTARAGAIDPNGSGDVFDLAHMTGVEAHKDAMAALEDWDNVLPFLDSNTIDKAKLVGHLGDIKLLSPLPYPGALFCAAANYTDHMLAMAKKLDLEPEADPHSLDVAPYHFLKPSRQSVAGPNDIITPPTHGELLDWEVELAAVIGRPARNLTVETALDCVAGYTVSNDISLRDRALMKRPNVPDGSLFRTDFIGMKAFDRACPIGPWITPATAIPDPQNLGIRLWLNDELMQNSSTSKMVFSVAEQIAHLSQRMTLLPGDIILTGTPAGTGAEQDRFLQSGEVMKAEIDIIGELINSIA